MKIIRVLECDDSMKDYQVQMLQPIQNSDSSALYFTQPIGINIAPTANIDLAVNGNISSTTVFTTNLSCVNASFDSIWARNMVIDPATIWECSTSNTGIINENVCYSNIFYLSCLTLNVPNISCFSLSCTNISCTNLYNNKFFNIS